MTDQENMEYTNVCFRVEKNLYNDFRKEIMGKMSVKDWMTIKMQEEVDKGE